MSFSKYLENKSKLEKIEDNFEYHMPKIIYNKNPVEKKYDAKIKFNDQSSFAGKLGLISLLDSPLIPIPDIVDDWLNGKKSHINEMQQMHINNLVKVKMMINHLGSKHQKLSGKVGNFSMSISSKRSIDYLRHISSQAKSFVSETERVCSEMAYNLVRLEINNVCDKATELDHKKSNSILFEKPKIFPLDNVCKLILRARLEISKHTSYKQDWTEIIEDTGVKIGSIERTLKDGAILTYKINNIDNPSTDENNYKYQQIHRIEIRIIDKMALFTTYDDINQKMHHQVMPKNYLNYYVSLTEKTMILQTVANSTEYKFAKDFINLLVNHIKSSIDHNKLVEIYKSTEQLALVMADVNNKSIIDWSSFENIIDTLLEVQEEVSFATKTKKTDIIRFIDFLYDKNVQPRKCPGIIGEILTELSKLTPIECCQISNLHKTALYAEIDEKAGREKYFKRVGTERKVEKECIDGAIGVFNYDVMLKHMEKTREVPNLRNLTDPKIAPKLQLLRAACDTGNFSHLKLKPYLWWSEFEPFDIVSYTGTSEPYEHVHDKGAAKTKATFGPSAQIREVFAILQETNYVVDPHNILKSKDLNEMIVNVYTVDEGVEYEEEIIAVLLPKEKEQKPPARYYGAGNIHLKHSISITMDKFKSVLALISHQVMTLTDKERKTKFHKLAQSAFKEGTVYIMSDIEGHNQSMQPANTSPLAERVGWVLGELNWGNLPRLFNDITIQIADHYLDEVYVTKGQLGGIEGWYGPLWTLYTVCAFRFIAQKRNWSMEDLMVYSDDSTMVLQTGNEDPIKIRSIIKDLVNDMKGFGLTIKLTQTDVTSKRMTLLRMTYFDGENSDNTLKRILAMSLFNHEFMQSSGFETDCIVASANSALEMSNNPIIVSYMKWYMTNQINFKNFILHFNKKIYEDSYILRNIISDKILYNSIFKGDGNHKSIWDTYDTKMLEIIGKEGLLFDSEVEDKIGQSPVSLFHNSKYENLYNQILRSKELFLIYTIMCMLPAKYGGFAVPPDKLMCITGTSDNDVRIADYILNMLRVNNQMNLIYLLLNAIAPDRVPISRESLLSHEYPPHIRYISYQTETKRIVKETLETLNKNKTIQGYIDNDKVRDVFRSELIEINSKLFFSRYVRYADSNSIFKLFDIIIKKFESTSTLLYKSKNLSNMITTLYKANVVNTNKFFENRLIFSFNDWILKDWPREDHYTMIYFFLQIRRLQYSSMITQFIEIPEVQVESNLKPINSEVFDVSGFPLSEKAYLFQSSVKPLTSYDSQGNVFRNFDYFGSEALYKGELIGQGMQFVNRQNIFAMKITVITYWIFSKSQLVNESLVDINDTNLGATLDLVLSTLTSSTKEELHALSPGIPSGKPMHRLNDPNFVNSSSIRVYPTSTSGISCSINDGELRKRGWVDCNVHFDYVKRNIIYTQLIKTKLLGSGLQPWVNYDFVNHDYIRDVDEDFTSIMDVPFKSKLANKINKGEKIDTNIFRYIAILYQTEDETTDYKVTIKNSSIINEQMVTTMDEFYNLVLRMLRQCKLNDLGDPLLDSTHRLWYTIKLRYCHINNDYDIEYDQLKSIIIEGLKNYIKDRASKLLLGNYTEASVRQNMLNYLEKDHDGNISIQNYVRWNKSLKEKYDETIRNYIRRNTDISMTKENDTHNRNLIDSTYTRQLNLLKHDMNTIIKSAKFKKSGYLAYLIVKYYLAIKILNGKVVIDINSTLNLLIENLNNEDLVVFSEVEVAAIKLLFTDNSFCQVIDMNKLEIARIIQDAFNFSTTKISEIEIQEYDISIDEQLVNVPEDHGLDIPEMQSIIIDSQTLTRLDIIKKIISTRSLTIDVHGNPDVYYSVTGSDMYITFLSLAKYLLHNKIVTQESEIIDLLAGRGDCNFAMTKLGLNISSMNRKSKFIDMKRNPKVLIKETYDVFNLKNLNDYITPMTELIIIDLSYNLSRHDDITSTLMNIYMTYPNNHELKIIIRINYVKFDVKKFEDTIKINFKYTLLSLNNIDFSSNAVFLMVARLNTNFERSALSDLKNVHNLLMKIPIEIMKSRRYTRNVTVLENSASINFKVSNTLDIVDTLISYINNTKLFDMSQKLITYFDNITNYLYVPTKEIPNFVLQNKVFDKTMIDTYCKDFPEGLVKYIVVEYSKRNLFKLNLRNLDKNQILQLSQTNRLLPLKVLAANYIEMKFIRNLEFNSSSELRKINDESVASKRLMQFTSIDHLTITVIMIYSALIDDINYGFRYLNAMIKSNRHNDFIKRDAIYNRMVLYKKLGLIFDSVHLKMPVESKIIAKRKIEEQVLKQIIYEETPKMNNEQQWQAYLDNLEGSDNIFGIETDVDVIEKYSERITSLVDSTIHEIGAITALDNSDINIGEDQLNFDDIDDDIYYDESEDEREETESEEYEEENYDNYE